LNANTLQPGANPWPRRAALLLGPLAALTIILTVPEVTLSAAGSAPGAAAVVLDAKGIAVLGLVVWMALWWVTECVALEVTGLLPLIILPVLGVCTFKQAAAPYADEVIGLFLGGMLLGRAVERWNVHRWMGEGVARICGPSPRLLVLGLLAGTAFLSMWISNLAAAVMMLPIARSLTPPPDAPGKRDDTAVAFTLAVAYGASIGGVGTLIGTPPTAQFAAFMSGPLKSPVSFLSWMILGVPVVVLGVLASWFVLTRIACVVPQTVLASADRSRDHAALSTPGRLALGVFGLAIFGWITLPILEQLGVNASVPMLDRLTDAGVSLTAVLLMFLIPAGRTEGRRTRALLTWSEASEIPWGVLVMFGGGLSLAAAIQSSGLDDVIAHYARGLGALPTPVLIIVITVAATALSEFMSNTALTALLLPIAAAVATRIGIPPPVLMIPAVLGASLAFMMPAGTPPNAVAFATGRVSMREMIRAGFWLNVLFCALTSALVIAGYKLGLLPGT